MYLVIASYLLLLLFYGFGLAAVVKDFLRNPNANDAINKKPFRRRVS